MRREKVTKRFMCRALQLPLLAPDFVEAALDGQQSSALKLDYLLEAVPLDWIEQSK